MLDGAALDGVLITAPSDRHARSSPRSPRRGLPILCEKPCGLTAAQTRAAVATAAAAGVPFQVAYWRRYVPALRAAARADGAPVSWAPSTWWPATSGTRAAVGVAFRPTAAASSIDMGVHEFDQLRWLTGPGHHSLVGGGVRPGPGGLGEPVTSPRTWTRAGDRSAVRRRPAASSRSGRYHPAGDMARAEAFGTRGTVRCDFSTRPRASGPS